VGEVTRILSAIEAGEPRAAEDLLPLVYDELRRLAAHRMSSEKPGQTLQPTALVHEAYLRLVEAEGQPGWNSRGHFFGAAARAMRRILIERARGRARDKRGGGRRRIPLSAVEVAVEQAPDDLLALDEALGRLERTDPEAVKLVELRYFAGMTMAQAAEALGTPLRSAERTWTYARSWLHRELTPGEPEAPDA